MGFITFGCESACDFPFYHMCPFFAHESNALLFTFTWDKQRRMIGLGPTLSDAAKLLHRVSITDFISAHVSEISKTTLSVRPIVDLSKSTDNFG